MASNVQGVRHYAKRLYPQVLKGTKKKDLKQWIRWLLSESANEAKVTEHQKKRRQRKPVNWLVEDISYS